MKGQTSIEYLAVLAITLAIFVPLFVFSFDALRQNTEDVSIANAQNTVEKLAESVDSVCALPTGSKKSVTGRIPSQVVLTKSGFGLIHSRVINFHVETAERKENITAVTRCNLSTYTLSTDLSQSGTYFFTVKKEGKNNVSVTSDTG